MMNASRSEKPTSARGGLAFLLPFVAVFLFASCLLDSDRGGKSDRVWDGSPGYVAFNVGLERNQERGLGKISASDTTFGLDSLIIVLSATGADTLTYRYAISGRPDTGVITVSPKIYALNPLLNWKARFYTIDTTVSPARRDTVHIDSVIFAVRPADTAVVNKTVSAAFSILHARFISSIQDSLGTSIRFIRLKVGGITRDSMELYGVTYNAVHFVDRQTGWLVQDSGRIQKTTDSGRSWYPLPSGTSTNLNSVYFANSNLGWVAGDGGLIRRTVNGGTSWSTLTSRTDLNLNRIHFNSTISTGYVVGDDGFAMKSTDSGSSWKPVSGGWFKSPNSNTSTLNDVGFAAAAKGFAVSEGGSIQSTTNFGGSWTTVASTTKPLNAVHFNTTSGRGFTVGDSGFILRYDGSSWAGQPVVQGSDLHGLFVRTNDSAWAVGDSERVVRNTTNGGSGWAIVPSGWASQTASPTLSWYGVSFPTRDTGFIVGASGNIRRTVNAGTTWGTVTTTPAITRPLRAVFAFAGRAVIAVGDSGRAVRSRDGGVNWNWYNTGAGNVQMNGVAMATGAIGWAVGASNAIYSSPDTGRTWTSRAQTGTWNAISVSSNRAFVAGNGGVVRRSSSYTATANFNTSVSNGNLGTTNLYGIAFSTTNADTGYAVGAGGKIYKTVNGSNGTATAVAWTSLTTPTTADLLGARFINGRTGWITGVNGTIWRTTDGGSNWTVQYHPNATDSLRGVWSRNTDTAYYVGANGTIRYTNTSGNFVSGKSTPQRLNAVHFPNQNVGYIVGSSGAISKTTNAGLRWTAQTNSDPDSLNAVHFVHIDTGWAVGNNGTLLKTVNGGTAWNAQTHPAGSANFRSVRFVNGLRGWVTGDNGVVLRTTDGGTNWLAQSSGTTDHLLGIHPLDQDTVYAVGRNGTIRKTLNGGTLVIFYRRLNSVYARGDSVYVVGDSGLAYRTRNGAATWSKLTPLSSDTRTFNSVFSTGNNAYLAGNGGMYYSIAHGAADSTLVTRTSNTTKNLRAIWGSPTTGSSAIIMVGDSGIIARVTAVGTPATIDTLAFTENLLGLTCVPATNTECWIVGSRELVMRNTSPNTVPWSLFSMGAKRFNYTLSSKYLRPGAQDTVILQAIDRPSPLRGYEKRMVISIGAGQDTTITTGMTRCGYGGATPECRP